MIWFHWRTTLLIWVWWPPEAWRSEAKLASEKRAPWCQVPAGEQGFGVKPEAPCSLHNRRLWRHPQPAWPKDTPRGLTGPIVGVCLVKETKARLKLSTQSEKQQLDSVLFLLYCRTDPVKMPLILRRPSSVSVRQHYRSIFPWDVCCSWRQCETRFCLFDSASQARWRRSCWSISQPRSHGTVLLFTHRGADFVAHSEVEAALLVHGVVDAGEFGELRPVVFKGVIQQAVVGAAERNDASNIPPRCDFLNSFSATAYFEVWMC